MNVSNLASIQPTHTLGQAISLILSWADENEADDVSLAKVTTSPAGTTQNESAQRVNNTRPQRKRKSGGDV